MATLKLDLFQINVASSSNGQVLTSNGTEAYWSTSIGYTGSVGFTGSVGVGYTGSAGGGGGGASVTISNTQPGSPSSGNLWWNSDIGNLLIYYNDGDSDQWVVTNQSLTGPAGYNGSYGFTGSTGFTGSLGATLNYNPQTTTYVADVSDNGGVITSTANVTINPNVFTQGQNFTVYNNTSQNITLIPNTGTTMYLAGTANTGNRTISQRGVATVLCVNTSSNIFVCGGSGVT